MAMDAGRLKSEIYSVLLPGLKQAYSYDYYDGHEGDPYYFLKKLADVIATAVANKVVAEITGYAKCNGADSHGDSHGDVGIV